MGIENKGGAMSDAEILVPADLSARGAESVRPVLGFAEAVNLAMRELAKDARTLFIGQSVAYDGATIFHSLEGVPMAKRIEMPVIEDFQMGYCIGLSLAGLVPISIYP